MDPTIPCGQHLARHAKLTGSRFEDVCLGDAEFDDVSLVRAKLHNVNLSDVQVADFQMGGATFSHGGSHPARGQQPITFRQCELVQTKFEQCDLSGTALSGCQLEGMTIDGVLVTELLAAYRAR